MNCPICHDIIVDESYARCEWCRIGAPMEAALEGVIGFSASEFQQLGTTTGRLSSFKPNLTFQTLKLRQPMPAPEKLLFFDVDLAAIEKRLFEGLLLPPAMTKKP